MFSVKQKRDISEAVQRILRDTRHPELPKGEIQFSLHVDGAETWSWADIRNNGAVKNPGVNPWNERQAEALPEPEVKSMPWPKQTGRVVSCVLDLKSFDQLCVVAKELGISRTATAQMAVQDFLEAMIPDRASGETLKHKADIYLRSVREPGRHTITPPHATEET